MTTLGHLRDLLANVYADPDKEDNWTHLEEFVRKVGGGEERQRVKEELSSTIASFEKREGWDHVVRLIGLLISLEEDPSVKADLNFKMGKILDDEIFNSKGARRAYEETLRLRQGDEAALESLNRLKSLSEGWRDVVERYLQEARDTEDPQYRSQLYLQVAALYQKFGGKTREKLRDVLHYLQLSLESDSSNRQAVRFLRRILVERKQWDDLVALYHRLAEIARTKEEKVEALAEQASILALRMGKQEEAATLYQQVVELNHSHKEATAFLVNFYTETGDSDKLILVYENILKSRPAREDELATLLQIGMVYWRVKKDLGKAEEYFKRLRRVMPAHPAALNFYRDYYSHTEEWTKLIQLLTETVRSVKETDLCIKLYLEIASISESKLGNVERGIEAYKAILKLDPGHAEATEALKERYRRTEKWNALLDILKSEAAAAPDKGVKIALLREIAVVYREKLALEVMVLKTYHQILDIDPLDSEAMEALVSIYQQGEKWNELAALYEKRLAVTTDVQSQVEILRRIAHIWMHKLANFNKATGPLEKILELEPQNMEVLQSLKGLYQQRRMWEQLFGLMEKEIPFLPPAERTTHLEEMARLAWEKLGKFPEAISLYWKILEVEPSNAGVLGQLEKLCERSKDWEGLAKVLEIGSGLEDVPDKKAALLLRWGNVAAEKLNRPEVAERAWRQLLETKPGHPKALGALREQYLREKEWGKLTDLYSAGGNWEALAEIFVAASDQLPKVEERIDLLMRAASLYLDKVGIPPKAHRCFEKILSIDPENRKAAEALLPIYEKEGNFRKLVEVQSSLLRSATDTQERLSRLKQLAFLHGEKLGNPKEAFQVAAKAYQIAPDDTEIEGAVELYGEKAAAWDDLISIYRRRIGDVSGAARRTYRRKLAGVLFRKVGRLDEALGIYESVLEEDPTDAEAYAAVEEILKTTGRLTLLLKLYEGRLERVEERGERKDLLRRMARIAHEGLDDPFAAARYYRMILAEDPRDRKSVEELETIYRITERWEDLVEILERKRGIVEGEDLIETVTELAEIKVENLGRDEEAMRDLEMVLAERPADRKAVGILEKLFSKDATRLQAAKMLRPHLLQLEKYSQYAWVLQILLEAAKNADERQDLYATLAQVYDSNLSDPIAASAAISSAMDEYPESESLWNMFETLAEKTGRWEEATEKLEQLFARKDVAEEVKVELGRRVARISERNTGDLAKAEKYHRWIFERDKLDQSSFEALEIIYTNQDRYESLKQIYRQKADSTADAKGKIELLQKIGFLLEDMLENKVEAISVYREILGLSPQNETARKALERLYEQTSMWSDLADLLEENLQWVPPEAVISTRFRLADILDRKLGDQPKAIGYYRQVLRDHPTHLKAQEALERMLGMDGMKQEAAQILEPLYESQGAYPQLLEVLRVRLEGAGSDAESIVLLQRMAEVQEKRLRDADGAFETLSRALALDPTRGETVEKIESLVSAYGYWDVYVEVLEESAAKTSDNLLRGELLFKIGKIHEEKLADMAAAEGAYRRFLELQIDDREMILASSRSLEKIYAAAEKYEDLVKVLRLQVDFTQSEEVRYDCLKRIAEIQESMLGRAEDAIETNLRILEVRADDIGSVTSLRRLYEATERWDDLVSILQKMVELVPSPQEKKRLTYEIASVYAEKIGELEEAIFTYRIIIEQFGEETFALSRLVDLYDKVGDNVALVATLDRLIDHTTDKKEKTALLLRAGKVERDRLEDLERAVDRFEAVLNIEPGQADALGFLEELVSQDSVKLKVAKILKPIYERAQSFEKLLSMLDIEIAEEQDLLKKVGLQRRAAEVAELGLGDLSKAFAYHADALRGRLDSAADASQIVDDLERITRESGDYRRIVDLYTQIAPDILDEEFQLRVFLEVAETFHKQLGDLDSAKEWYTKVLDRSPMSVQAISALEEIYTRQGDYAKLIEVLKMKCDITEDYAEKVNLLNRQARIAEEELRDEEAAIAAYEGVLEMEESEEAVRSLERLYAATGRWGSYRDILERQIEWPDADRAEIHHRLGLTLYENLGDPEGALNHFREALKVEPGYKPTMEVLEKRLMESTFKEQVVGILEPIYLSNLELNKLLSIMEVKLEFTTSPEDRKEIYLKMGKIYEEQVEDLDAAFGVYARLLQEDIESKEARQNIDRLANVLDIWPRAAEVYKKVLGEVISDTPATADLWYHLGIIQDSYCEDPEGAILSLRRALSFDPTDKRVFSVLEGILKREDKWAQQLYDLYKESAEISTDAAERKRLKHFMGRLSEERLSNRSQAIEIWKEVVSDDPKDEVAIAALERLYYYERRFHDLADLLLERIARAENAFQQVELRHRLAGIYSEHLNDRDTAIDLYEQVLSQDSAYQDSILALEGMIHDEERQKRVVEILIPIYKEHNRWQKLILAFQIELRHLTDPIERKSRFGEIGRLAEEKAGNLDMAFEAFANAFKEDPADSALLEKVMQVAEKTEKWEELATVLDEAAGIADMPSIKATLLRWEARVLDRRLGDFRSAVDVYRRLLEIEEGDPESLEALDALYTLLADWEGLLWALDLKANFTIDEEELLQIRRREGEICEEQLGDIEKAISYYKMALEIDASSLPVIGALERLYEAKEKWQELASLLLSKAPLLQDKIERRDLFMKLAAVQKEKLENVDDAIASYRAILEDLPEDVEVMQILDGLLAQEKRWEEYYENLEKRAKVTFDDDGLVEIYLLMGEVLQREIGDVDRAIETYQKILEIKESEQACQRLEAIAQNEDYRQAVVGILEPIYRRGGEWNRLLALYRLRLEILSDPSERAEAFVQIATLQEQGLGDKEGAFITYLDGLREEGWVEEIYRKADILAGELGKYEVFASALEEKVGQLFDLQTAADLSKRIGAIWEEKVGDVGRAIASYRRVLEGGVEEKEAISALKRLYTATEAWKELLEIVERELSQETAETAKVNLLLQAARIRLEKVGDTGGAVRAYGEVLRMSPDNAEATGALEGLLGRGEYFEDVVGILGETYRMTGNLRKLVDLLDLRASRAESVDEKVEILREEALVAEEELKDPDTAMRALSKAIWESPEDRGVLDELERLCDTLGAWDSFISTLTKIVEEKKLGDDTRKEMMLRMARWAKEKTKDHKASARWYARCVEMEPENTQILEEYEEELYRIGDYWRLLDVMEKRVELEYDSEKKRSLLTSIADLSLKETGEPMRAAAAFERLLILDDTNVEVIDALLDLKLRAEEWGRVVELLERRIEVTADPSEANGFRFRLADILVRIRGDETKGIEIYREILETDPENEEAVRWLEHLFEKTEKWYDLRDLLVTRLDRAVEPQRRFQVLLALARLLETKVGDVDGAIDYLMMAYEINPAEGEVVSALERLLSAQNRLEDLIELLRRRSEQIEETDPAAADRLLVRIGEIYFRSLGESAKAVEYYERVLERDVENVAALNALAVIHEANEEWSKCISVLGRAAGATKDLEEMGEIFFKIGMIKKEKMNDLRGALEAFNAVLEVNPGHPKVLDELLQYFELHADWQRYLSILDIKQQRAVDPNAKVDALIKMGKIMREKLGNIAGAISCIEKAQEIRPGDMAIKKMLIDAYLMAGDSNKAAALIEKLIEEEVKKGVKKSKELSVYMHMLGRVYEQRGELDAALSKYEEANKIDLSNFAVNYSLGALYEKKGEVEKAMKVLRPLLLQNLEEVGIDKAEVYYMLGRMHAAKGEKNKAINMIERGLAVNPAHTGLKALLAEMK